MKLALIHSLLIAHFVLTSLTPARAQEEESMKDPDAKPAAAARTPAVKIAPRFKVTGITWPAKPGDAEICLWKDDKIAAVNFTVDDNNAPDIPWWLKMADKYGIKITWFVITKRVGTGDNWGNWDTFRDVLAKGQDVQSHTHTHLHTDEPGWKDIEWEYTESKKLLEENLPGHRIRFLAYPGGKNSGLNNHEIAAKYYAGARTPTGTLIAPNVVNYMAISAITESSFNNPKAPWADLKTVLDPASPRYRAWACFIYHTVKNKPEETPLLNYIAENKDKLWLSFFGDTSMYGQERDTATLQVTENAASKIAFNLTDKMKDEDFDFPLTVKVALPAEWKDVTAEQNGKPAEAKVVENEGKKYALVQATPDRGAVTLSVK